MMTAIETFDWKTFLLSFDGRIRRQDYWLRFVVPYLVISIVLGIIDGVLGLSVGEEGMGILSLLFILAALWPSIAVAAKRWHDRDKSGWWTLIVLIPIVGSIWFFVEVGCLRGTVGPNRFGSDPLEGVG